MATLDHSVFRQMMDSFKEGLGALDQGKKALSQAFLISQLFFCSGICSHCCSALDKLADFYYHNQDRETATAIGLKKLVLEHMPLLNDLLGILFQILCFEPQVEREIRWGLCGFLNVFPFFLCQCLFQWSISRPMLVRLSFFSLLFCSDEGLF